jgi:hypothetical protein
VEGLDVGESKRQWRSADYDVVVGLPKDDDQSAPVMDGPKRKVSATVTYRETRSTVRT